MTGQSTCSYTERKDTVRNTMDASTPAAKAMAADTHPDVIGQVLLVVGVVLHVIAALGYITKAHRHRQSLRT